MTIILALALLFATQTTVVEIKDNSTTKCSVRMGGTIAVTGWEENGQAKASYVSHVSATNLSNQPIIAMITFTDIGNSIGPLVGANHKLDAYFAHDLEIAPGQTTTHEHNESGVFSYPAIPQAIKHAPEASSQSYLFSTRMAARAATGMMAASKA